MRKVKAWQRHSGKWEENRARDWAAALKAQLSWEATKFGSPDLHKWMTFLGHALHPRYRREAARRPGYYSAIQVKEKGQLDGVLKAMSKRSRQTDSGWRRKGSRTAEARLGGRNLEEETVVRPGTEDRGKSPEVLLTNTQANLFSKKNARSHSPRPLAVCDTAFLSAPDSNVPSP